MSINKLIFGLILITFFQFNSYAHHVYGGEFEYEVLDSVNRIYLIKLYFNATCLGGSANNIASINATYSNGCTGEKFNLSAIAQPPNGFLAIDVTPICAPYPVSSCIQNGGIFGVHRYIYQGIKQFQPNCGIVKLSFSFYNRYFGPSAYEIKNISNSPLGYTFETEINLDLKRGNNSAQSINKNIPYLCGGEKLYYNFSCEDKEGDSLHYSIFTPLINSSGAGVIYDPGYSASKPCNMVESNILLDKNTGQIEFTPLGLFPTSTLVGIKVQEFRRLKSIAGKDSMVYSGSVNKDFQFLLNDNCKKVNVPGLINSNVKNCTYTSKNKLNVCNLGDTTQFTAMITAMGLPLNSFLTSSLDTNSSNNPYFKNKKLTFTSKKDSILLLDTLIVKISLIPSTNLIGCSPIYFNFSYCNAGININYSYAISVCNNPIPINPIINISTSTNKICTGTPLKFYASNNLNSSKPIYTWFKNSQVIGTGDSITISILNNQDTICCTTNAVNFCNTATSQKFLSNKIIVVVTNSILNKVQLNPIKNLFCSGDTIILNTIPAIGITNPSYQWFVNHTQTSDTQSIFSAANLNNGDIIYCKMSTNIICAAPSLTYSDTFIVNYTPITIADITLMLSSTSLCSGDSIHIKTLVSGSGNNPIYYWYKNNILIDSNFSGFNDTLNSNAKIYCTLKSNATCIKTNLKNSDTLSISTAPRLNAAIHIISSGNIITPGSTVKLNANTSLGGFSPRFEWWRNGQLIPNSNLSEIILNQVQNNDTIYCKLFPDTLCLKESPVISNSIIFYFTSDINTIRNHQTIKIVPNPFEKIIHIEFSEIISESKNIKIFTSNGETIITDIITPNTISKNYSIEEMPAGIYILQLKSGSLSQFYKIVKQ